MIAVVKKADIILAVAILLAVAVYVGASLFTATAGAEVVITVDGEQYGAYPLSTDATVEVSTDFGNNTVVIKKGKVTVSRADCPDGYCVSHIAVDSAGETIVCLPHRVVIEIRE